MAVTACQGRHETPGTTSDGRHRPKHARPAANPAEPAAESTPSRAEVLDLCVLRELETVQGRETLSLRQVVLFRGTFVFKSHVGKKPVKSCFHIYGRSRLTGGKCQKLDPLAYKAYPFKVSGIRQRFSVKVTWFVKEKGPEGGSARRF